MLLSLIKYLENIQVMIRKMETPSILYMPYLLMGGQSQIEIQYVAEEKKNLKSLYLCLYNRTAIHSNSVTEKLTETSFLNPGVNLTQEHRRFVFCTCE